MKPTLGTYLGMAHACLFVVEQSLRQCDFDTECLPKMQREIEQLYMKLGGLAMSGRVFEPAIGLPMGQNNAVGNMYACIILGWHPDTNAVCMGGSTIVMSPQAEQELLATHPDAFNQKETS